MNSQKPGMFVPALVGGAVAGVLSGIPFFNCLCCIWVIGGAMLAAYLLVKDSPVALRPGDGAIVGIFTGIVAAIVETFIQIPLHAFNREIFQKWTEKLAEYMEEVPSGWENLIGGGASLAWFLFGLLFTAVFFSALGACGGIIGISLFKKKNLQKTQGASDASENTGDRQP